MLEKNMAYRGILDDGVPRLVEVELGGPFEYVRRKHLFSSEVITLTHYCARAGVKIGFFPPVYRVALISVTRANDRTERLFASIPLNSTPYECHRANYGPFPELQQARAAQRRARGKTD